MACPSTVSSVKAICPSALGMMAFSSFSQAGKAQGRALYGALLARHARAGHRAADHGRCGEVVHAGHALKVVLPPDEPPPRQGRFPFIADGPPAALLGRWHSPGVLVFFSPEGAALALMYSPFETRRRTRGRRVRAGAIKARYYFSSPLSLTLVCSNAGRRKCSWTHVNAAVPMDLVDSQTKSDASTFARPPMPPPGVEATRDRALLLRRRVSRGCYLVDPASSHMLVSKIKPCMCKYEQIQTAETANGSLNQL
ncbi:hypothetical protein H6P81_021236 [Aristolochia fimbriata]|uniref:Uncharacterized protein n=1 Tax=Aristolochia fimbriata TaxID=158543 RepID=A0AAV7DRJ5_ARIFI|nr:hypothetical protein H6P81_021236 [Aristolochia fimbriata]